MVATRGLSTGKTQSEVHINKLINWIESNKKNLKTGTWTQDIHSLTGICASTNSAIATYIFISIKSIS